MCLSALYPFLVASLVVAQSPTATPVPVDPAAAFSTLDATVIVSVEISPNTFQNFQTGISMRTNFGKEARSMAIVATSGIDPGLLVCETFDSEDQSLGNMGIFTSASRSGFGEDGLFIGSFTCNVQSQGDQELSIDTVNLK